MHFKFAFPRPVARLGEDRWQIACLLNFPRYPNMKQKVTHKSCGFFLDGLQIIFCGDFVLFAILLHIISRLFIALFGVYTLTLLLRVGKRKRDHPLSCLLQSVLCSAMLCTNYRTCCITLFDFCGALSF